MNAADVERGMMPAPEPTASIAPDPEADAKEPKGPQRGADGKFVSSKAKEDAPAADEKPAASKHSADDIRKAVKAAQRDDAPRSVLDAIEKDDADTIKHYLKRAKVQQDGDDFGDKFKTLQQEHDSLKASKAKQAQSEKSQQDIAALTDPLAAKLQEWTGDEGITEPLREAFSSLQKSFSSQLEQRDQQNATLQKQVEAMAITQARTEIISDFPEAKSAETWKEALAMREDFPITPNRPDLLTQMSDIMRYITAPSRAEQVREARAKRDSQRDDGASPTPARSTGGPATKTRQQLSDSAWDAAQRGDDGKVTELLSELKTRNSA